MYLVDNKGMTLNTFSLNLKLHVHTTYNQWQVNWILNKSFDTRLKKMNLYKFALCKYVAKVIIIIIVIIVIIIIIIIIIIK